MRLPQYDPSRTPSTPRKKRIDRRLQERVSVDCQVRICWQDRHGSHVFCARAVDMSKFGLRVEAERALEPGTVVCVETNSAMLGSACVRHCTPNGLKVGAHVRQRKTASDIGWCRLVRRLRRHSGQAPPLPDTKAYPHLASLLGSFGTSAESPGQSR
jgi:hypothetical protein